MGNGGSCIYVRDTCVNIDSILGTLDRKHFESNILNSLN